MALFKQDVCHINGEWRPAVSGKTFAVHDPASTQQIGSCAECNADDTTAAIAVAAEALRGLRKTTARQRSRWLHAWFRLVMEHQDDLARIIVWENGKPFQDARGEVAYAASFLEWFAEEGPRAAGQVLPASTPGNSLMTVKEPVGVCGLITPWNFPAAMITRKIGPAIAAGCSVVAKSPGETPFTALALVELASRAGIPPGVVNIISALENTKEVGAVLTASPTVRKVSFTGSTGVGKLLMQQSADTMKKLSFELGGNAPFIVFEDANLEAAVAGAIACKFRSSGQTCVCANRIFVQATVYEEFTRLFCEKVRAFKVGVGSDSATTHGPLIHDRALAKVDAHVRDAIEHGAECLLGGTKLPDLGPNFYATTVLRDVTPKMRISREETFGPVAGLIKFETEEEVIRLANESEVGLAGYFYSENVHRCRRVATALEVGMVGVNTGLVSDPAGPFGGVKESGFGREGSREGIAEYQTTKMIMMAS